MQIPKRVDMSNINTVLLDYRMKFEEQ